MVFEYLGGGHEGEDGPLTKLRARIFRAIPLEQNPNRKQVASEKSRDGTRPPEQTAPSPPGSGGKVRRTAQIVKRENKMRWALFGT